MPLPYNKAHKERARGLRSDQTSAEKILWDKLRRKRILGVQFYRQKPIGHYVVDFYCARANLVIEIDGGQHRESDHAEADRLRDQILEQLGLQVLRFTNEEVLGRLDSVVEIVRHVVAEKIAYSRNRPSTGSGSGPPL